MCTVTFIAQKKGYCLGMNRDEKLTRVAGLPPARRRMHGRNVLCPSEPAGGTWIALNDAGVCFSLINWYAITDTVKDQRVSRGEVVNAVSGASSPLFAQEALISLPLAQLNPFRLVGIFPATNKIVEWRWDRKRLVRKRLSWKTQQWISSGWDEPGAQRIRGATFRRLSRETSPQDLRWLRMLHRSHAPERGPFSTCVHRDDAATVSYTEVAVTASSGTMSYRAGPPCTRSKIFRKRLLRSRSTF